MSQLLREREIREHTEGSSRTSSAGTNTHQSPAPETSVPSPQHSNERPSTPLFATFRRQISAQSIPAREGPANGSGNATRDEVLYEQEERPLVNMEDLGLRNGGITNITASPMPRRPSMLSRLGSRLLPRYTTMEHGEDRVLRRRLSDTPPPRRTERATAPNSHRFSMFGSSSASSSTGARSSERRTLAPISRPIPLVVDGSLPSSGLQSNPLLTPTVDNNPSPAIQSSARLLRSHRLARVRQSLSGPLESLFSTPSNSATNDLQTQTPPRRPSRLPSHDRDYLLPPLSGTEANLDLADSAIPSIESTDLASNTESSERPSSWAQRWTERAPTARREARRMPNLLRGRSSRIIRRDDEAPLSRILQLAAAAIAAQLSGAPEALTNMQAIGGEGLDGSLNNFIQTLNNAATTAENENEGNRAVNTLPPLNFLRVFRFVNSTSPAGQNNSTTTNRGSPAPARSANRQSDANAETEEALDGRTVTLVVVGVRSVPSANLQRGTGEASDPSLDTLLSLPLVHPTMSPLRGGTGGLLRHADGRSRFAHRRRASMGGVNTFPANYDSQRHQRMHSASRPRSGTASPISAAPIPMLLPESPPGPHPPPTTPAEPSLSAQPSATTTPARRPSSASAAQHAPLPILNSTLRQPHAVDDVPGSDDQASDRVRQRRRSDSEFARHRDLGAGAARRNGVVEPDDAPSQGGRSWLIYVVGTNLSEDHPAFATPSLFTDVSGSTQSMYPAGLLIIFTEPDI